MIFCGIVLTTAKYTVKLYEKFQQKYRITCAKTDDLFFS